MTFQADWDKTGTQISGKYLGIFPYSGIIESTRVCYGGDVEYTVRLMDMIEVYGEYRSIILVRKSDQENYSLVESD